MNNQNLPDNSNIIVQKANKTGLFTNYIYKAIPLAFDESMSYYETLCGLLNYLENTIIPTVNNNADAVSELQNLYTELRTYVDEYFKNLDVQEEINNKLDEMTEDGTLTNIIKNYVDPIYESYESEINARVDDIDAKVNSATSGSPLVASSTAGMTDTTRVYVNTTDGKWYYYDGDSWEIGGTYQATELADGSVTYYNLDTDLKNQINSYEPVYTTSADSYINASGTRSTLSNYATTSLITLKPNSTIYLTGTGSSTNTAMISTCTDLNEGKVDPLVTSINSNSNLYKYTNNSKYDMNIVCCFKSNVDYSIYIHDNKNYDLYLLNDNTNLTQNLTSGYLTTAGTISSSNFMDTTDYIEINNDQKPILCCTYNMNPTYDSRAICFYDDAKTFISGAKLADANYMDISTVSNAKYVRFTITKNTTVNIVSTKNDMLNYFKKYALTDISINNYKDNLFASFLKFGVVGDSLASGASRATGGNFVTNYDYSWPQFIAKKLGITAINFSDSGLTTRSWLTSTSGLTKLQNASNKCNSYIICLGVNDAAKLGSNYLGSVEDIDLSDYTQNADTFYGNYGRIISNIKLVQPKAKIFIFTIPNSNSLYTDFNEAIRDIAELYDNVYLIDLNEDYINLFASGFVHANVRGGHFNAIGYNYIGNVLLDIINNYMYNNYSNFSSIEFIGTNYTPA